MPQMPAGKAAALRTSWKEAIRRVLSS